MCNYITDQLRWCDFNCHKWERFVTTNYTKSTTDHAMWQIWSSSRLTSNIAWFVPISCHCFSDCSFIVMTICNNFAQISVIAGHLWLSAPCWENSQDLSQAWPTIQIWFDTLSHCFEYTNFRNTCTTCSRMNLKLAKRTKIRMGRVWVLRGYKISDE